MRTITVQNRQTIMDIAIQYYGSAASVFDLCVDNDLELDSDLVAGQLLFIQDTYPSSANGDIADYLQGNSVVVVSDYGDGEAGDLLIDNAGNLITANHGAYIQLNAGTFIFINGSFLITNRNDFLITS